MGFEKCLLNLNFLYVIIICAGIKNFRLVLLNKPGKERNDIYEDNFISQ